MREPPNEKQPPWWAWLALALIALSPLAYMARNIIAEQLWGGPHVIENGEAYSFSIGMTKAEVFEKYRELGEIANIRCYGPGPYDGDLILDFSELKFSPAFQASDHWMAYRECHPVEYQEFFFANGKLTKLLTYIRYHEVP
jgi:hypothetical protein